MQPGFFDHEDRLKLLEKLGGPQPKLEQTIAWERYQPLLASVYKKREADKGGPPPFDAVLMLRQFLSLSDDQANLQVGACHSYCRFLGLSPKGRVPGARTIWLFQERLRGRDPVKRLFHKMLSQTDVAGCAERVHCGAALTEVPPTQRLDLDEIYYQQPPANIGPAPEGETVKLPFGRLFGTRSGDKGGNANCGVWARSDAAYRFLHHYLTAAEFKRLLPDMAAYEVERYELPNLRALNFYIKGLLGTGTVSNNRMDKQAKSLGEYLRAKHIEVPAPLAEEAMARSGK